MTTASQHVLWWTVFMFVATLIAWRVALAWQ